jgi:hypothetical protein
MWPARVRPDQHVIPKAQILLDVGEAAPLHPSPVARYGETSPPPVLTPPVEEDGDFLTVSEGLLEGVVQLWSVPCHNQQARHRLARTRGRYDLLEARHLPLPSACMTLMG